MSAIDRLQGRAHRECIPLNVSIEITLRCNLRCVHCYNFDRKEPYRANTRARDELSDDEIHRVIDEVRAEGCLFLAFTGGEAMVHPSLDAFVAHARSTGAYVRLKSNGVLLTPSRALALARAGVAAVDLSLYGAQARTHDAFVMRVGAFDATIAGARAARDAGIRTKFNITLSQANADEVEAMINLAADLDVPWDMNTQITDRQDRTRFPAAMRLDRDALERLYRGLLRYSAVTVQEHPDSVQCSCARSVCGISAFGEVYPCIGAPMVAGSIRTSTFHEAWTSSPVFRWIRGLTLQDFAACRECVHRAYCRRSSGVVYTNSGVYTGPERFGEDWACMEAELVHELVSEDQHAAN